MELVNLASSFLSSCVEWRNLKESYMGFPKIGRGRGWGSFPDDGSQQAVLRKSWKDLLVS